MRLIHDVIPNLRGILNFWASQIPEVTSGNSFSGVGRFCEAAKSFEKSPTHRVGLQRLRVTEGALEIPRKLGMTMIGSWLVAGSVLAGNLLPNGDFERADPHDSRRPWHWDLPDGIGVQWVPADHGRAIRMDTSISEIRMNEQWTKMGLTNTWFIPNGADNSIAETYGLSYYSDAMPVKAGQAYRVSFDYRGAAGGGKVWVRCYGLQADEQRRLYEKIVFCGKKGVGWVHYSEVFFPTKFRPAVTEMRVMLYAYYPAGLYWYDNVVIAPITPEEYDREKKAAGRIDNPSMPP